MKLSDINLDLFGIEIRRDGEFSSLGSFTRNKKKMLVFIQDQKFVPLLKDTEKYSSVICSPGFVSSIPDGVGIAVSGAPLDSYYRLHNFIATHHPAFLFLPDSQISPRAVIHQSAHIDPNVTISDGCVIGPNATILKGTILEENVIIGPGSVIGGEGFRFLRTENGIISVIHMGGVIIRKNAEIQANTCVDKALYGDATIVGEQTKIDNLVHVGHNALIGERCLIAASAMIGGSTIVGNDVWIGPNASISDNLVIEDSSFITMGAVVTKNVLKGQTVSGNFAIDHAKFLQFIKSIR